MDSDSNPTENTLRREVRLPEACAPVVHRLFAECAAERWQLSFRAFEAAVARSAAKRFPNGAPLAELQGYLLTLHLRDLALACACEAGSEQAWEDFVAEYRGYLRAAAAAILRSPASDSTAAELADSLLADLYGLGESHSTEKVGRRSLFRYFHGRSSLKTWLRAVLAQRNIDRVRAAKRFDSLDDTGEDGETRRAPELSTQQLPADPRREQYLQRFREALASALAALDARDRARLQLYYAEERTLAEIGREIGEHESSVSRNLERVRNELRSTVEGLLRAGRAPANGGPGCAGLDDAQVQLCIQYAAEDAAIDLEQLFDPRKSSDPPGRRGTVKP